ncbi:MAG: hypothetical protein SNH73_00025 [Rikenellaceae bacterium]
MKNIAILIVCLILCCGCQTNRDFDLERKISESHHPIELKDIADFSWDTIYVVKPYDNPNSLNIKAIPRDLQKNINKVSLHDSFCLLVFTQSGEVVKYVEIPRSKIEFFSSPDILTVEDEIK